MKNQELDLPRLRAFVRAKFYEPCQCGVSKFRTNFCCDCAGLPFCEKCKNKNIQHDGHKVLQVCRASWRAGINIFVIKNLLEVSDIQSYKINANRIVFISRRQSKEKIDKKEAAREGNGSGNACELCGWPTVSSPARFCSIECKADWLSKEKKSSERIEQENPTIEKPMEKRYEAPSGSTFEKRQRKKLRPSRSPLM